MTKQEAWAYLKVYLDGWYNKSTQRAIEALKPELEVTDEELRAIDKPFGELPRRLQEALVIAHYVDGKSMHCAEYLSAKFMNAHEPVFYANVLYRLAPEPKRLPQPPWHMIDPKYKWYTANKEGCSRFYAVEPLMCDHYFYPHYGEVFEADCLIFDRGNVDWNESKVKRPEGV